MTETPAAGADGPTVVDLFAGSGSIWVLDQAGVAEPLASDDLDDRARRLVSGLEALGVGPGDRVGLFLPNGAAYLTILLACARMGAVAVAVNTRFRSGEVGDIVGRSGCRVLFVQPGFAGVDTSAILGRVDPSITPRLETIAIVGDGWFEAPDRPWAVARFDTLCAAPPSSTLAADRDAPFAVFTTSGTTSAPKLVLHRQASIADHAIDVAKGQAFTPDDRVLLCLPLCGVFGFVKLMAALAGGADVILAPLFDADIAARFIGAERISLFTGTDDMIHRMLESGGDWSTIRFSGTAKFNNALDDLPERAADEGWTLIGLYGMSEVQSFFAGRDPQSPFEQRVAPGGRVTSPRARARVVDPDSGKTVAVGEEGELQVRGPSQFAGYLETGGSAIDESLTAAHFTADGWFRTGDLARWEGDDTFEYLARMGDVLRLGGFLVAPAEIEDRLLEMAPVETAQVVAVDSERGPRVVGFVTLGERWSEFDEAATIGHCRAHLASFKVPVRVLVLDAFPLTESANGFKIQKVRLRELAEQALTDRGAADPE